MKRGGGTLVRGGTSVLQAGTVVEAGTLVVSSATALGTGPLTILTGGTVAVQASGLSLSGLAVDPGGVLDIGTARIGIATAGIGPEILRDLVIAGRQDQAVAPGGILSRAAAVAGLTVGHLTAPDGGFVVRMAAPGDTNLDGQVDMLDVLDITAAGLFDTSLPSTWSTGDFNYDGITDILDLMDLLDGGFYDRGPYLPASAEVAAVPEPTPPAAVFGVLLAACAVWARLRSPHPVPCP